MSCRFCAVWLDLCLTRWVSELHDVNASLQSSTMGTASRHVEKTAESKQQSAVFLHLEENQGISRRMRVWKNEGIDGKARNGSVLLMFCSIVRRDGLRPHIGIHTFVCCEEEGSQWAKKEAMCYTRIELKKAGSKHISVLTVPRRFQKAPSDFRTWIREELLKVTRKALQTAYEGALERSDVKKKNQTRRRPNKSSGGAELSREGPERRVVKDPR